VPIPTVREDWRVIVNRVDPRDESWEGGHPVFRVYFWKRLEQGSFESEEFELLECEVTEALRWAEATRGDRTFTLYVRRDDAGGVGLLRLAGTDPTATR
jgi:hypothetical protein